MELGRKGVGGRRREGGKQNLEKLRKISQHFVVFCNKNRTKRREPLQKGVGSGSKRCRKREYNIWKLTPLFSSLP